MPIGISRYISIYYEPVAPLEEVDYCLQFSNNGYIDIDALKQFFDHRVDFYFEMQFKIKYFPHSGFNYLMNSCYHKTDNKIGVAVDGNKIYVQVDKGISGKTELYRAFTDTDNWHTLAITQDRGSPSATLDDILLTINPSPSLSLPLALGCNIAMDTLRSNGLYGSVDNILLADTRESVAQYPLNTGHGTTAYDSVGSYNGTITNGEWQIHS